MLIYIVLALFLISVFSVSIYIHIKNAKKENNSLVDKAIKEFLLSHKFEPDCFSVVSKKLILALNKQFNKIALIENFNEAEPETCKYFEMFAPSLMSIENSGFNIKLNFRIKGHDSTILIQSFSKDVKKFCHELYQKVLIKKLELRHQDVKFDYFSSSNWECDYLWAFDSKRCIFGYYSNKEKLQSQVLNLKRECFTIDLNYNYLELPLANQAKQLLIYDKEFLPDMFSEIYKYISRNITSAYDNKIFYDNLNDIIYLSNSKSTFQSLVMDKIEEVFYRDNSLQFTMKGRSNVINFPANKDLISEFTNFITGYNLRQIANHFDYSTDKLINANTNTKFIIDNTRDRVVYCANLNKLHSFSYLTISFSSLASAKVHKNAMRPYVRIVSNNADILDVTCLKIDVANYIKAQIDTIVNK